MTEIRELSGDIDIMRTKLNKQAEIIKARDAEIARLRAIIDGLHCRFSDGDYECRHDSECTRDSWCDACRAKDAASHE